MDPVALTFKWIEVFVVKLNLCPFAALPLQQGLVYVEECDATGVEEAFYFARTQALTLLREPAGEVETILCVFTRTLIDFPTFLDFVATIEALLEEAEVDDHVQLAHFHPRYRFADAPEQDPAHFTNRAPFPTVQLLRVASVSAAVDAYPDVAGIPARNVAKLRQLGGVSK